MNIRSAILLLSALGAASVASAEPIGAGWKIVVPARAQDSAIWWSLWHAADELRQALREETGAALAVVETDEPVAGRAVYVGSAFARRAGLDADALREWENAYAEKDGNLYLYGNRERCGLPDRREVGWGHCVLPSVRALTRFMEDRMGVRFVMPGVTGMEVPHERAVDVPVGLKSVERPKITFGAGENRGMLNSIANQCFGAGAYKTFGGHLYPVACPFDKYAKTHPEYFGIVKGKRYCEWPWARSNWAPLCFTNPEVEELIVAELLRRFDAGADACQLAPGDSALYCACEKCRNYGGIGDNPGTNHSEQIWLFHRHIAERIEKLRPGKIVHILSYGPTRHPPRDFKTFPPNVMIEVCEATEETLKLWNDFGVPHGLTVYIYLWGNYKLVGYTPRHSFRELAETARMFMRQGIHGIYRCGYGELWGLEGPGYYVFNRMLRDPAADIEATVGEYCAAAFGSAAETMRRFYDIIDVRLDRIRPLSRASIDAAGEEGFMAVFAKDANLAMLARLWPQEALDAMGALLKKAEATPGLSERQARRLRLVGLEYKYLVHLMTAVSRYAAFKADPCARTVLPLADAVDARNAFLERFVDPKTGYVRIPKNWPELRPFSYADRGFLLHNGRSAGKIDEPLDWKTDAVRAAYRFADWQKGLDARPGVRRLTKWRLSDGQQRATLEVAEGGRELHVVPAKENNDVRIETDLTVNPKTKYRISWLVKMRDVRPTERSHEIYAMALLGPEPGNRRVSTVPGLRLESTDWLKQTLEFETGETVRHPTFAFRLWHCTGEAWYRDVVIEE